MGMAGVHPPRPGTKIDITVSIHIHDRGPPPSLRGQGDLERINEGIRVYPSLPFQKALGLRAGGVNGNLRGFREIEPFKRDFPLRRLHLDCPFRVRWEVSSAAWWSLGSLP